MELDTLLTPQQVADHYSQVTGEDIDVGQVHYARKRGYLTAVKVGWVWVFPEDTLPKEWPVRNKRRRENDGS